MSVYDASLLGSGQAGRQAGRAACMQASTMGAEYKHATMRREEDDEEE